MGEVPNQDTPENTGRSHFQDRSPGSISQRSVAAAEKLEQLDRLHAHELSADAEPAERWRTRLVQRRAQSFGTALVKPSSSSGRAACLFPLPLALPLKRI